MLRGLAPETSCLFVTTLVRFLVYSSSKVADGEADLLGRWWRSPVRSVDSGGLVVTTRQGRCLSFEHPRCEPTVPRDYITDVEPQGSCDEVVWPIGAVPTRRHIDF